MAEDPSGPFPKIEFPDALPQQVPPIEGRLEIKVGDTEYQRMNEAALARAPIELLEVLGLAGVPLSELRERDPQAQAALPAPAPQAPQAKPAQPQVPPRSRPMPTRRSSPQSTPPSLSNLPRRK